MEAIIAMAHIKTLYVWHMSRMLIVPNSTSIDNCYDDIITQPYKTFINNRNHTWNDNSTSGPSFFLASSSISSAMFCCVVPFTSM